MIQSIPTNSGVAPGGAVGGASNLTTVGAIPYVSSAGVLNQDATKLFWDSTNGRLGVGTNAPTRPLTLGATTGPKIELYYGGDYLIGVESSEMRHSVAGAGIFSWRLGGYTGTEIMRTAATTGNLLIGGTTDGNYKLDVQKSGSTGTVRIFDQTATTGSTLAVIQAGAGQSGNLLSVRNNAGTEISSISATGGVFGSALYVATGAAGEWGPSAFKVPNNSKVGFVNGTNATAAVDTAIMISASGILEINNGTVGTHRDLRLRTLIAQTSIIQSFLTPASASDTGTAGQIAWDTNYIYICTATNTWKRVAIATW